MKSTVSDKATAAKRRFAGLAIPGWTSVTMTASFFGAMNALGIAILGEYVTRIYDQVRARPLYLVARRVNSPRIPHPPVASKPTRARKQIKRRSQRRWHPWMGCDQGRVGALAASHACGIGCGFLSHQPFSAIGYERANRRFLD
jgi:hypothetical protein